MIILFDLDGTLIDSTDAVYDGFVHAFVSLDKEAPKRDELISLIGYPLEIMFEKLGGKDKEIESLISIYKEYYKNVATKETTLLDGAKEAVLLASDFADLGVVTTKTAKFSIDILKTLEIYDYFRVVIGRESVINPKPDAEPILKALESFDNDSEIYMIGDTSLDVEAANAAGVKHIALSCGYGDKVLLSKCAKIIKKDAKEAILYLKNLQRSGEEGAR